ncbi:TlpA family protein disulfide reductase [Fodinibius sp. Rm-B-1B1-1]|uniref:TlpA family protein disulfide reductase n=1 Tax=Fodinibius alkaliphilus TaxID=3140241 RepID=UPI00315AE3CA
MGYLKTALGLFLSLLILTSVSFGQGKKAPPPPPGGFPTNQGLSTNSEAPNFAYETLNSGKIKLSDYRGEYVLIDFWGTWCKPCLENMPYLKEAYSKYSDDITFISVAADDNKQAVVNYVNDNDIPWTQIVVPLKADKPVEIIEKYNVRSYPSVFLIDPNGVVLNGAQSPKAKNKLKGDNLIKTLGEVLNK